MECLIIAYPSKLTKNTSNIVLSPQSLDQIVHRSGFILKQTSSGGTRTLPIINRPCLKLWLQVCAGKGESLELFSQNLNGHP